jgi:hypothetical protein
MILISQFKPYLLLIEQGGLEGQGKTAPKTLQEMKSTYLTEYDLKVGKQLARHNYNTLGDIMALEAVQQRQNI